MSGFQRDGSYQLTRTKAEYWCRDCPDARVWDRLERSGFTIEDHGTFVTLRGPGLADGCSCALYMVTQGWMRPQRVGMCEASVHTTIERPEWVTW